MIVKLNYHFSYKLSILLLLFLILNLNLFEFVNTAKLETLTKCTIKIPNDIPENEPIYLKNIRNGNKYELFKPNNQINHFGSNKNLTLYCPGKNNYLLNRTETINQIKLKCYCGHFFDNNDEDENIEYLQCSKTAVSELRNTRQYCANNRGIIYEIGFTINGNGNGNNFIQIFKICFDNQTQNPIYSVHQINGAAIKYSVKENKRKDFKTTGMTSWTSDKFRRVYQRQNQFEHFRWLFGEDQQYINITSFLARGHLTPDGDFIFPSAQLSTYYYANVAPEFQIVNAGNWKRVENLARELASSYNTDMEIYTGTYDILKLKNRHDEIISASIDESYQIKIPKWFWKIIKNTKSQAAIVMITMNNPFANYHEIVEFCPNVCNTASLNSKHFKNIRKGYTFCCQLDTFMKVVNYLPLNLTSNGLLNCSGSKF